MSISEFGHSEIPVGHWTFAFFSFREVFDFTVFGPYAILNVRTNVHHLFNTGEALMGYYAAFLKMKDTEKNQALRPAHLEFLVQTEQAGRIFARGKFTDNAGGLVIYLASSYEEALKLAESDPYVVKGARTLELHEWDVKIAGQK
jgi:uncharacterized protein